MLALEVLLNVKCVKCSQGMAVTVRCEGDGLMEEGAKALLSVACSLCDQVNYAVFVPDSGEIVEVMDGLRVMRMPEPSMN